jgi:erythromycin esterase-like protein
VVEGDWPDALRVDRYVRHLGDDESSQQALGSFERFPRWLWRNRDVVAMLDWLRAYNGLQRPERRAGFYGLDLYATFASIQCVLSHLDEHAPEAARIARRGYACFDHASPVPIDGVGEIDDEVIVQLVEMQRRRAARSGRTPAGDAWWNAICAARIGDRADAYYRSMFSGCAEAWRVREERMADTIDMLAGRLASPKLVVWAHNAHVGDGRATALDRTTLGRLMRERHPGEVALVGFTTHDGSVLCADDWDAPVHRESVRPSLPGSWEELFHGAELPRCMMTAAALRRALGADVERLERSIGVVYRPETERRSHYHAARIADQFDVVVHVDRTRAVEPLDGFAPPRMTAELAQSIPVRI